MQDETPTPPLADFLARRFAAHSPFWSWLVFERLGGAVAYVFARLGVRPATVTLLGGAAGVAGAIVLGTATGWLGVLVAGALLLIAYTMDCADGQLARATGTTSDQGAWLDVTMDAVVLSFVSVSLAVALLGHGDSPVQSLVIAGAFGAGRMTSLFTASRVRSEDGGIRLSGAASHLRTFYTALIDTPFVYVVLCASRLSVELFRITILVITLLSVFKAVVSARHHFNGGGAGREPGHEPETASNR